MREPSISKGTLIASITLMIAGWLSSPAKAQMDHGPKTDKSYGIVQPEGLLYHVGEEHRVRPANLYNLSCRSSNPC